jgi:hypothetical protein
VSQRFFFSNLIRACSTCLHHEQDVTPNLHPRLHFVPKEDGKIYKIHLSGNFANIQDDGEDTEIEPHRAAFIKATIALWEQEWLEEEAKKLGRIAVVKPLPDVKTEGISPSGYREVKGKLK